MNRINLICLGVRDMAKSVTFYRDGLGFETKETADSPNVIFF
ncbi:VOC family protein [Streptococcus parauberis]|nr:VOC family protein [Streptococcus parauberis]MDT2748727.1 VOC family protein [Streptococcus parauberis]